jgi:hypothetical protein
VAIATMPAALHHEIAWNSGPLQASPPALYSSIDARVLRPWNTVRGRQYELDRNEAGSWRPVLDNRDGALDPNNEFSPFWPNVIPYRPCRVRTQLGVNMLSVDQATAGEGSGFLGSVYNWTKLGVTNDFGYQLNVIASGSAWQGTQVYQAVLPATATQFATVVMVQAVHVEPGQFYSFTAQAQVTAGNSPSTNLGVLYYDNLGNELAADGGASATLTAGAGTWTQLTISAQAPTGAYSAWIKVEINQNLTAQTTFLVDGLQFERSMTPTPWQMPLTLPANLFPRAIATGTQSIDPVSDSPANWFYPVVGSVFQSNWLAPPASGQTTALAWTTPAGTTSSSPLYVGVANPAASAIGAVQDITPVTAGLAYTASVYMTRTSSLDLTLQVTVSNRWLDASGNLISTSSGTAVTVPALGAWVRGTVTATAPANAVWVRTRIFISSPSPTTASNTIVCAGWQLEQAGAASTWMDPGPTRYIFTGFMEQFPQAWELSGTWGRLDAVAVDALGGLGVDLFFAPFLEEVLALGPTFVYQLAEPTGASMLVDTAGNCPNASTGNSPGGVGSLTLGSGISGGSTFTGTQGPVAAFANTPSTNTQSAVSYIALQPAATTPNYGVYSSTGAPATSWTRMIAFNAAAIPAHPMYLWSATMSSNLSSLPSEISIWIDTSGHVNLTLAQSVTFTQTYSSQSYCDGNWHLVSVSVDNVTGTAVVTSMDGVTSTATASVSANPINMNRDTIGARIQDPAPSFTGGANASVALAIQWPFKLTAAQIANLYGSWRSASAGESSGARAQRVLTWAGWTGATAIDTGTTADMGPASDLAGSTAISALQSVAATENGNVFVATGGAITFKGRGARYNQNTPQMIFGENWQWGEWPYEDGQLPTDPIHTYNDIQIAQYSAYSQYVFAPANQQTAFAQSAASQLQFFDRVLAKTINVQSFAEAAAAASYLLGQYQSPQMRAKAIKLNCSAIPGLFAACLGLEIGSRVRQMKRSPYRSPSTPIQMDGFVERIAWSYDPRGPKVFCTLELSPALRSQYWTLSALRTALSAQAASGQNQAQIYALPDSAVNNLAASLPQNYQLTFDPGTQFAETMTIQPPLPATNVGYSRATLTFTSNFQFTHQPGAVVCEPLPAGYTNPATWDPNSILGAGYTTVATASIPSSAPLQVGLWTDSANNLLSQDLGTGDLLWLGVGTPNFEGYNLLHPNASTAGEGAIPLAVGSTGAAYGIAGAAGTPTVTASGSAWQGSQVWQTAVAASHATPSGVLFVNKVNAVPGFTYAVSAYMRSATTGANPQIQPYIEFLDINGAVLASQIGTTVTLTGSPTAAWTRASAASFSPAGTVWVQMGLVLVGTAPSVGWNWQGDGLQVEQAATASAYQTCPQVLSVESAGSFGGVGPTVGGTFIQLAQPMVNPHAVGEWVCDPLPPGTTTPLAVPGTARLAY